MDRDRDDDEDWQDPEEVAEQVAEQQEEEEEDPLIDENLDADAQRNLELLQQLGMLGPAKKKKKKNKPKTPKKEVPAASRASARIKGEHPEMAPTGKKGEPVWQRLFQDRGYISHSFRNIIFAGAETYSPAQAARLSAKREDAPKLEDKLDLNPAIEPCSHCKLRKVSEYSACGQCGQACGRLCAPCLWRRYGEVVAELGPDWSCPECRQISNQQEYREKRGWGALGESCYFDAVNAGYASVAHWTVLRRVEMVLASDVQEAIPNRGKRGRPLGGGGEFAKRARSVQRSCSIGQTPLVLVAGVITCLGVVPWNRPGYISPDYFYPIGYQVLRLYPTDTARIVIEMTIVDGGDKPIFRARALDRPLEVYQGPVSSAPLVELLKTRTSKPRTISGPRMMYLDDVMVRAALHTQSMDAFAQGKVPPLYRHMHAFYGVLSIRKGMFVAVRAPVGFYVAQAAEDCFIMRGDVSVYAFRIQWCEKVPFVQNQVQETVKDEGQEIVQEVVQEVVQDEGVQPMEVEGDKVEGAEEEEEEEEEDPREYILNVGEDTVLSACVFHVFQDDEIIYNNTGDRIRIADHVCDITALSDDLY